MSGLGPDVWMSAARRGLEYHEPANDWPAEFGEHGCTVCGRSMRTGVVLDRQEAVDRYAAQPCKRQCWKPDASAS